MALLMEEECWEPSGIEVIIPVKPADIQSFVDNAQYVFQYWDLKPTIKGRADFTFKETKWHLYSEKSWGFPVFDYDSDKKSKVVMGGVQYLLDGRNISDLKTIHRKILDKGIILFARMGEIHVPPPRESVEYTEKTINFVKTRLNEIENEIKKTVETKMASVSSEYEARKLYLDLFRQEGELNIVQDIIKDAIKIKFKDVEILTPEFESPFFISSLHFYEDRQYNTRVKLTQWHHKINLIGWEKIQSERGFPSIFYNLGEKGAGKLRNLARHYLKQHNLPTEKKIWVIQPNSLDELKNFCSEKGIDFGLLHNIDEAIILPPKPAKQKVCVEKPSEFYNSWVYDPEDCIEEKDEEFNVLNTHLEYANVDFQKDSGYYIVREGKYIPHYGSFSQISSVLKELDPDFKDNPVIYVVTARYEKKMGLGWKQLAPNVKSLIEAKWAEFKVQKIHYSNLSHQLPCYGTCELDKMKGFYEKGKLKNDVLKEFFSIVALDDASRLPYSNWTNSFNLQTPNLDDQKRVLIEKASELWKKLIDSAPLIRHIPYHNWNQPEVLAYLKEKTE